MIFVQPWASSLVVPCLGMTGAWLLSASLPAGSGPGVLQNKLLPLTSQVFPLVGNCAANSGRLSIPLTLTRVAALRRQRRPCAVLSPLGPTFVPSVTLHPRSPYPG